MNTKDARAAACHSILYGRRPHLAPWGRRCTRCRETRNQDDFAIQERGASRAAVCKPCRALEARERRARRQLNQPEADPKLTPIIDASNVFLSDALAGGAPL